MKYEEVVGDEGTHDLAHSGDGFRLCVGEEVGVSGSWILLVLGFGHCVRRMMNWVLGYVFLQGDSREGRRWSMVVFWVVRCEKDEPAMVDHGGAWLYSRRVEWKIIQIMVISWWSTTS
ncbi:hypothetical protein V8G54_028558 [Vigna mungo]|uniref:Uncharacterized protein n=1 Tax=Vigna mungo TaxID=3915 RepID=A0AAQ3MS66_VIGMU